MTNDKALEAALKAVEPELFSDNPEVAHKAASPLKVGVARDEQVAKITAAISAYISALPGEAEVVAWRGDDAGGGRKFTAMSRVSEIWADQCLIVTPLVTLTSYQAMQARAEAAERERDAFRDMADGYGKLDAGLAIAERRAETAEARVKELEEERDALRKVISECASALPNGAFISPKASVEFMAMLPAEIASVCAALSTGGSNG